MQTKIVTQLKTGAIKNVVPYGDILPKPPYIVVRPEYAAEGKIYRIFVHMIPGQQIFLEDYTLCTVSQLLTNFKATTRHGNYNQLLLMQDYGDITTNDDGTISMERRFLMPSRFF